MDPHKEDIVTILANEDAPNPQYFGYTDADLLEVIKDEAQRSDLCRAARTEFRRRQRVREAFLRK